MRGVLSGLAMSAIPLPALRRAKRDFSAGSCASDVPLAVGKRDYAPPRRWPILRLPLKIWFHAIRLLFVDPNMSAAELQRRLSIRRLATVRGLARRVRAALTADDCTTLLAGLDHKSAEAASSAPSPRKTDERGGNIIPTRVEHVTHWPNPACAAQRRR